MEKIKEIIANTIVESLEHDFLDKKYTLGLDSHNCYGMMKSDVINTNLRKVFDSDRYIIHKFKRFAWEGRFIIDLETKSLVSITSISNLNHIPNVKVRSIPHYMQTLLYCLNEDINSNQQIYLDGFERFDNEIYEDDFKTIVSGLNVDFNEYTYYIVAYDFKLNKVIDMDWYLLGPDFNIAEKVTMMDFVNPDYIDLTESEDNNIEKDKSTEEQPTPKRGIKLGLKEKKLKKEG